MSIGWFIRPVPADAAPDFSKNPQKIQRKDEQAHGRYPLYHQRAYSLCDLRAYIAAQNRPRKHQKEEYQVEISKLIVPDAFP